MKQTHNFEIARDPKVGNLRRYDPTMVTSDKFSLWIADTDFLCPEEIINDLKEKTNERTFGYTFKDGKFEEAVANWQKTRFGWDVNPNWVGYSAGVIAGIGYALRTFTNVGDKVVIQKPVYQKFEQLIENNGRRVINNSLKLIDGRYEIDFNHLEKCLKDPQCTMMIVCNPHNPTSRCFTKEELIKIGNLCVENNVLIISDEIHQDIVFSECKHISIASLDERFANNSITYCNPSKTFNIPGLYTAAWIAPNPYIKERLDQAFNNANANCRNTLGVTALVSAYTKCAYYADEMMVYLEETRKLVKEYLEENIPEIKLVHPEAMYLFWLDCRDLGFDSQEKLAAFLYEEGNVYMNSGARYGDEGIGFMRLNVAAPRSIVMAALESLKKAVDAYRK